jgi:2'-5' RNA ligase
VALDLPEDTRRAIVEWRSRALGGVGALRLVRPEGLHVTLAFLGSVPEESIPRVGEAAFARLDGLAPPVLSCAGLEPVPPRRARLFALDLLDTGGAAAAVAGAVSESLSAAGLYEPERRPFWPHVTVARVRAHERAPSLEGVMPPPSDPFSASSVVLYRSRVGRSGAAYEPLASRVLSG